MSNESKADAIAALTQIFDKTCSELEATLALEKITHHLCKTISPKIQADIRQWNENQTAMQGILQSMVAHQQSDTDLRDRFAMAAMMRWVDDPMLTDESRDAAARVAYACADAMLRARGGT